MEVEDNIYRGLRMGEAAKGCGYIWNESRARSSVQMIVCLYVTHKGKEQTAEVASASGPQDVHRIFRDKITRLDERRGREGRVPGRDVTTLITVI